VQVRVWWSGYVLGSVLELAGEESVVGGVLLLSMTLTMAISIEFLRGEALASSVKPTYPVGNTVR
jgi:hypothetical protein